jgi:SAM-dependent methyltransferase
VSISTRAFQKRASRAIERQLSYQRNKAAKAQGHEDEQIASMMRRSREVRAKLDTVATIPRDAKALEVGCGAHGLIFFFDAAERVGVDPLADHYRSLFPAWQDRARTIASGGEALPLEDASFDVVLCDNVVDHAENPRLIVEEIARVLKPGGALFFTVNVHHPFYHVASKVHAGWRALGIPFEVRPFADHTVHLTLKAAAGLFEGLPFELKRVTDNVASIKSARKSQGGALGNLITWLFYKNALFEVIAIRR